MSVSVSKFKKLVELCESEVKLPPTISITDYDVPKDVYLLEELFLPLIAVYADYLAEDLLGRKIFNLEYKRDSNALLYFKISDNEKDDDDDSGFNSEAVNVLFLMESMYQVFPKNAYDLSKNKFYDDIVTRWRIELDRYKDGQAIDVVKLMSSLIKESLYINLTFANKQGLKKNA